MNKIIKYHIILLLSFCFLSSCEKWVETPIAKNQIESNNVFADSISATAAILGAYYTISTTVAGNFKYLSLYGGDLNNTSSTPHIQQFVLGKLTTDNSMNLSLWGSLYNVIYQCNVVLDNVSNMNNISESLKTTIISEAYFLRAYSYFYLLQFYDNIPLAQNSNLTINKQLLQSKNHQVVQFILNDLSNAIEGLPVNYIGAGKVRANQFVAKALMAKMYLQNKEWNKALELSSEIINSGQYSMEKLEDTFLANSKEAVWQFSNTNGFITDATSLIPSITTSIPSFIIDEELYKQFTPIDLRKEKWISKNTVISSGITTNYFYVSKYKNRVANTARPEFLAPIRLAEIYLIRAEALVQKGSIKDAIRDINVIKKRAGVTLLDESLDKESCILEIKMERRLELFAEFSNRFIDLKRWDNLMLILSPFKSNWTLSSNSLPIPQNEIFYNQNLKQNEGY